MTAESIPGLTDPPIESSVRGTRRRQEIVVPLLVSAVAAGVVIWTASFPGLPMGAFGLSLLLGTAGLVLGLTSLMFATTAVRRMVIGLTCLTLIISSVVVSIAGLPLRARFAASATEFESVVARADAQPLATSREDPVPAGVFDPARFPISCPAVIGVFRVYECMTLEPARQPGSRRGYMFLQTWNALTDDSAIVYLPNGPVDWAWDPPRHLSGPWYAATCGC